jgi:hypothetical protein
MRCVALRRAYAGRCATTSHTENTHQGSLEKQYRFDRIRKASQEEAEKKKEEKARVTHTT